MFFIWNIIGLAIICVVCVVIDGLKEVWGHLNEEDRYDG